MKINILSFGLKYNHIIKSDMQIDARCLINPYYQDSLKELNGLDNRVSSYIMKDSYTKKYLKKLNKFLEFYLNKISSKKEEITISFMCTGGKHRSVFLATYFANILRKKYDVFTHHIDINE